MKLLAHRNYAVVCAGDASIALYAAETGLEVRQMTTQHPDMGNSIRAGDVVLVSAELRQRAPKLSPAADDVLLGGTARGEVHIFALPDLVLTSTLPVNSGVEALKVGPAEFQLVMALEDRSIQLWDWTSSQRQAVFSPHAMPVKDLQWRKGAFLQPQLMTASWDKSCKVSPCRDGPLQAPCCDERPPLGGHAR